MLILEPLRKYAQFSGRARRKEFWLFALSTSVVMWAARQFDPLLGVGPLWRSETTFEIFGRTIPATAQLNGPIELLIGVLLSLPIIAVTVRRLHDISASGLWVFALATPLIGWIGLVIVGLSAGDTGTNEFGEDPKKAAD
jgi:uncharacterized membrane protein YhaH (DUF805 family)